MSDSVGIVVTTYMPAGEVGESRLKAYEESLISWSHHLHYDGKLFLCVADDGSDEKLGESSVRLSANKYSSRLMAQHRHGVGASLNKGFSVAFLETNIAMYMVDDWALCEDFDITPWVKLLEDTPDIGVVRLGPPHPGLTGTIEHHYGSWILRCNRHNYVYGMRPALYHKRFFEAYGNFDEDISVMECERLYNERFCKSTGPDIVVAIPHPWYIVENVELGYLNPITERDE